ncbi:MAG: methionyl-tRNA formyltransferase [Candidatus Omnitrophica bacterium]|nr:methionyl-tRNA formyltransferase [Candidatus Omnitrophota bacterium]
MPMRVIFFGTSEFAVPSLEALAAAASSQTVVMCVTQPDRPRGRGLGVAPSPVKRAAARLGLPLMQPERLAAALFQGLPHEVGVVAAYGQLIPQEVLALPTQGMLGVHPSLLPKYRGAAPVAWAILNGEATTGVSIFKLNKRLDAGELLLQETVPIEAGEDAHTLTARLARCGAQTLLRTLEMLAAGRIRVHAQDESRASLAPKLTKAQGEIDWQKPAEVIERLVRATVPWPGAATAWRGGSLKIVSAGLGEHRAQKAVPGTVVDVTADSLAVAAGQGTLIIREVQPAGKRRMGVREFLAGHPIKVGDILGVVSD